MARNSRVRQDVEVAIRPSGYLPITGYVSYRTVFWKQEAHDCGWKACLAMQTPTVDKKKIRDQLKTKRNLLLEEYSKHPMNTRLAIEIRLIDDQVAELTEHLVQKRKSGLD